MKGKKDHYLVYTWSSILSIEALSISRYNCMPSSSQYIYIFKASLLRSFITPCEVCLLRFKLNILNMFLRKIIMIEQLKYLKYEGLFVLILHLKLKSLLLIHQKHTSAERICLYFTIKERLIIDIHTPLCHK